MRQSSATTHLQPLACIWKLGRHERTMFTIHICNLSKKISIVTRDCLEARLFSATISHGPAMWAISTILANGYLLSGSLYYLGKNYYVLWNEVPRTHNFTDEWTDCWCPTKVNIIGSLVYPRLLATGPTAKRASRRIAYHRVPSHYC
jgi:hypothetical protein